LKNSWLGHHFKSFYLENIRERKDVSKHALSDSKPLDNMAINVGCTPARPIESLALAHGLTWWAYALNNGRFLPWTWWAHALKMGGVTAYVAKH